MPPRTRKPRSQSQRDRSPRGASRNDGVGTDQRGRIVAAMIDAVAQKGYRATTVADVIGRAGMSRKTFYQHFANKEECFLFTYDRISATAVRRMEHAYESAVGWPGRVQAAIRALFDAALENPGAVRLILLEVNALGSAGIERRERSNAHYERFIRDALALAPGSGTLSEPVLKAIVGGLNRVLSRRVLRGGGAGLIELIPDLVIWVTSYYPTPESVMGDPGTAATADRKPTVAPGGRAPGTLAPHAVLSGRRGLPRGEQGISRSFVIHNQRERILDAVANLTAARGYIDLKVEDIAEEAAVSLNAFYEHFADKEDALLVAYEVGHTKALAITERAYHDAGAWQDGVRAGLAALLGFLAAEPSFAHLALVDVLVATERTMERSNLGVQDLARMLVPRVEEAPGQLPRAPVTIEAIAGGIYELCLDHALHDRTRELAELSVPAAYIALAPFLGAGQAARVALDSG